MTLDDPGELMLPPAIAELVVIELAVVVVTAGIVAALVVKVLIFPYAVPELFVA
ncbi:MAG: hypothetical protein PHS59_16785 [Paludibacter sp.]|jgi:hypothetical protein|nr:hypothetical protein [Paludibacter sp.]